MVPLFCSSPLARVYPPWSPALYASSSSGPRIASTYPDRAPKICIHRLPQPPLLCSRYLVRGREEHLLSLCGGHFVSKQGTARRADARVEEEHGPRSVGLPPCCLFHHFCLPPPLVAFAHCRRSTNPSNKSERRPNTRTCPHLTLKALLGFCCMGAVLRTKLGAQEDVIIEHVRTIFRLFLHSTPTICYVQRDERFFSTASVERGTNYLFVLQL